MVEYLKNSEKHQEESKKPPTSSPSRWDLAAGMVNPDKGKCTSEVLREPGAAETLGFGWLV